MNSRADAACHNCADNCAGSSPSVLYLPVLSCPLLSLSSTGLLALLSCTEVWRPEPLRSTRKQRYGGRLSLFLFVSAV